MAAHPAAAAAAPPPPPSPALLGLGPIPPAAGHLRVPEVNYKSPVKELYDKRSHCGNLEYKSDPVPGSTSQDAVQWNCTLACPSIAEPYTGAVILQGFATTASGHNKKEAEQQCAFLALCRIAQEAPALGVRMPPSPFPPPSTSGPLSTLSDPSHVSGFPYSTGAPTGSTLGSMPSSGPSSVAGSGGASRYYTPLPSAAAPAGPPGWPPSPLSGLAPQQHRHYQGQKPTAEQIEAMGAEQARAELRAALQREAALEARLSRLLTRLRLAVEDELEWEPV